MPFVLLWCLASPEGMPLSFPCLDVIIHVAVGFPELGGQEVELSKTVIFFLKEIPWKALLRFLHLSF